MAIDDKPTRVAMAVGGIAVLLLAGALVWWWTSGPAEPAPTLGSSASEADSEPPTPPPRRRVPIPRPVPSSSGPDPATPGDDAVAGAKQEADTDDEIDSGVTVPPVRGATSDIVSELRDAMSEVGDALVECLQGWGDEQPDVFQGRAVFSFQLDEQGVAEMDVMDVETVPETTLACLGDVLWEDVEWPRVQQPLTVSWPIQVSIDEGEPE